MDRVKATNSVPFASRDLTPGAGTPQYFTSGVPGSIPATILPGYWLDMVQDEILQVISDAGIAFDDTDWGQLSKALKKTTLFNVQAFVATSRISMAGNAGNSWTVAAWNSGSAQPLGPYVKKSATSKLITILNAITYCAGATAPSGITLTVGGVPFPSVASNNFSGTNTGASTLINVFSGLAAGSLALSLSYSRNDSTDWTDIFNPITADNAYLAAVNPSVLLLGELGI
jgi:hypothetical protein